MTLASGVRLGSYEVLEAIGAGGMGEVYRAKDTQLKRHVALKVLPDAFALDPERMARFRREAEVLASFNHPNIAHVYGLEEFPNPQSPTPNHCLILELVEGEDLAERLKRGAIPIEDALKIARQIAEALEAAHERSIVHRDLKPANVKPTPDGTVKILDFGLAKAVEPDALGNPSLSPTLTAATQPGVILGTAAYMAPEQAKGRVVDKRADIWAFGCVLYELLTARRAFDGEDISETLAFVLTKEPDWSALPAATPHSVQHLLRRCLDKDPRRRLRDIGEARIAIDAAAAGLAEAAPTAIASSTARRPWAWITTAGLLAAAIPAAWLLKPAPRVDQPLMQLEITPPDGVTLLNATSGSRSPVGTSTLSRDGRYLAFRAATRNGRPTIWLRAIDSETMAPLQGTEGVLNMFWSFDSRWIAFNANGKLQRIPITGGAPQFICNADTIIGGDWNADGVILFGERDKPLQRVPASGGTPVAALPFDVSLGETSQAGPLFLPDGRRFLYSTNGKTRGAVMLSALDDTARHQVFVNVNSPAHFAQDGAGGEWLLYVNGTQLFARPFDSRRGTLTGDGVAITDRMAVGPIWSTSSNGLLVFQHGQEEYGRLTWVNRDGSTRSTIGEAGEIRTPRIAPDGQTVAFARRDLQYPDIWIADVARGTQTRITLEPGPDAFPSWTPDGRRLVFYSRRGTERMIVERPLSGAGETVLVRWNDNYEMYLDSIGGDGRLMAFTQTGGPTTRVALLTMPEGTTFPIIQNETAGHASVSPDGRYLLYTGFSAGRREVYVQALDHHDHTLIAVSKRQVSATGGYQPSWRRDGKEIFYIAEDLMMTAVAVESSADGLRLGAPQALFPTRLGDSLQRDYDVTADGQRFLIKQPVSSTSSSITVVVNWPKLLQK